MIKAINSIKDFYIYIFLFFISNFFLLINYEGLYWDDWVAYDQKPETLTVFFGMIQHGIKGDFYLILSKFFNHIYAFRLFIFFAYLFIGYFIYRILFTTELFSKKESKFIAFLSVIVPITSVKIFISITPFVFPMLLFYFAFFLLSRNYPLQNKSLKIITLTIFFFSFNTNSILVFYVLVPLYLYYMDSNKSIKVNFKIIQTFILKQWDFILLPIVYFVYKSVFLLPYGLYGDYNKINFSVDKITNILFASSQYMTVDLFVSLLENNSIVLFAVIVSGIIAFLINYNIKIEWKKITLLLTLSILLFVLAVLPYAAVNKTPVLEGVNGRFTLLLCPSIAMFFIGVISLLSKLFSEHSQKVFLFFASFLVITMISKNISQQYEFILDNFYQASIVENFKNNEEIKQDTTFVVYPYKGRAYYAWNGLLKKAFGDTTRLMIPKSYINKLSYLKPNASQHKQYNFYQWDGNQTFKNVYIQKNMKASPLMQAKLLFFYLFNTERFIKLAKKLVKVDIRQ